MRNFCLATSILIYCCIASGPAAAQSTGSAVPTIKYISKEAIYVNAGRNQGVSIGDTLRILRKNRVIAFAVVKHISAKSSASQLIRSVTAVKVGDRVSTGPVKRPPRAASTATQRRSASRGRPRRRRRKATNLLSGFVSLQNYWQQSLTGSKLTSTQPSVSGKIRVKNIAGTGLEFRLRQRSRRYFRSGGSSYLSQSNEWVHRVFEVAFVYDVPDSPVQLGIGRVYSPHIRGIGYIDGAYFSTKILPGLRVGLAAGTEPDPVSSGFEPSSKKIGAFVTLENGSFENTRLATTIAASASYEAGVINREFLYLQNNLTIAHRLYLYQSVEIDVNRDWRRAAQGQPLSFSNFYLTANYTASPKVTLYFGYDARKNVRTYTTMNTPDSLFDASTRQGVNGGVSWNLSENMRFGANASVRFRQAGMQNNYFSSIYYNLRHVPLRGHTLTARVSYINTQFTSGYRPTLFYRMPVTRRVNFRLGGGGYIYKTGAISTKNYYAEAGSYISLWRHYYLSTNFRQYFDTVLQSRQIFTELGMNF